METPVIQLKIQDAIARIQHLAVPITITVSFYVFGFFIMAETLGLSGREIVIGLISGAVGGVTTLIAVLYRQDAADMLPSAAV